MANTSSDILESNTPDNLSRQENQVEQGAEKTDCGKEQRSATSPAANHKNSCESEETEGQGIDVSYPGPSPFSLVQMQVVEAKDDWPACNLFFDGLAGSYSDIDGISFDKDSDRSRGEYGNVFELSSNAEFFQALIDIVHIRAFSWCQRRYPAFLRFYGVAWIEVV